MEDNRNVEYGQKAPDAKPGKPKKSLKQELREWVVSLGVALIVVFVVQTFFFRIIRVDGQSMETTLHNGERVFVNVAELKFTGNIDRNSIVICNFPNRHSSILGIRFNTFFVKRLVGVPGDKVYRKNGVTHVVYEQNGQTIDNALDDRMALYHINGSPDDYDTYTLGSDEYFVVGDNRYNSHDSRDWRDGDSDNDVGPISKNMIVGKVQWVLLPLKHIRATK